MPLVIGDHNWQDFAPDSQGRFNFNNGGEVRLTGLHPRSQHPQFAVYGSLPIDKFSLPLIPMEAWPDAIADQERNKSSLWHVWKDSKICALDQDGLSYCHAFSATDAVMVLRESQGLPYVELSASSVGGPVTGYHNAGAYIFDDLEQIVRVGVASTQFVPMRTTSQRDFEDGWKADAANHSIKEWECCETRNFVQQGTALLSNFPTCDGFDWMGHAMTGLRLIDLNNGLPATDHNRYEKDELNSWGTSDGQNGVRRMTGSRKIADECYIPRVAKWSKH